MPSDGAGTRVLSADCMLEPGADEAALGAAVTVALCGHWEHEGACRWPHRNETETGADGVTHLQTTVSVDDAEADEVERRFRAGLATRRLTGPDGTISRWRLVRA